MDTDRRMQKSLKYISQERFPIFGDTINSPRGMPEFRKPSEYSEEGLLRPTAGEYSYERIRRRAHKPPSSPLSTTGHVELENGSPPTPSPSEDEMCDPSCPAPSQQTPAQSTSNQMYNQHSGGGNAYNPLSPHPPYTDVSQGSPHYVYGSLAEPLSMQGIEGETYPRAIFTPGMDTSASAPHDMQWNFGSPISSPESLGHNGSMTSPQTMTDLFWLGRPYNTDSQ